MIPDPPQDGTCTHVSGPRWSVSGGGSTSCLPHRVAAIPAHLVRAGGTARSPRRRDVAAVSHAHKAAPPDDDMIQKRNVKQLPGLHELPGGGNVVA